MIGRGHAFRIEHLAASLAGDARHVHDVQPDRENLLAESIGQEGILLLDVEGIERIQDGIQHLLRHFAVYDRAVLSAAATFGADLHYGLFQGRRGYFFGMELLEQRSGLPPSAAVFAAAGILNCEFGKELE